MIIVEINSEYELEEQLEGTSYNDFSLFGLETIMNYINECYTTYTFEPCGFGSEFTEFSDAASSTLDLDDLINDYGYLLDDEDPVMLSDSRMSTRVTLDRVITDEERKALDNVAIVGKDCVAVHRYAPEIKKSYFYVV